MAKRKIDKNLRSLISYLVDVMDRGMVEPGRREVIERRMRAVRKAARTGSQKELLRAIDELARAILRGG